VKSALPVIIGLGLLILFGFGSVVFSFHVWKEKRGEEMALEQRVQLLERRMDRWEKAMRMIHKGRPTRERGL